MPNEAIYNFSKMDAERLLLWMQAPSTAEKAMFAEIDSLPALLVPRADSELLERMGMIAHQAHANCLRYARQAFGVRVVSGWRKIGDDFVFHSVAENRDGLICLSPEARLLNRIEFRPDPQISWEPHTDGHLIARRAGKDFYGIVRKDPQKTFGICLEAFRQPR